jgi:hypothetical protein
MYYCHYKFNYNKTITIICNLLLKLKLIKFGFYMTEYTHCPQVLNTLLQVL